LAVEGRIVVASDRKPITPIVMKAARSTYYVAFSLWFGPAILAVAVALRRPTIASLWEMVGIVAIYGIILFVWVRQFSIELGNERMVYSSLFGGRKEIRLKDIESVVRSVGMRRYRDRFLPPIRLEVIPKSGTNMEKLTVNAKVFDREALDVLMTYLGAKHAPF
jgi:hypothetical protein